MKIQYKVEQDDLHAFLIYTMRNNYEIKRQRRKTCIVIAACSLLIATYLAYQKQSIIPLIWFGLFGGYLLHMSRRVPTLSKEQASRLYPENNNQSVLCEHTLELTESGIVETTHTGSQVTKF